MRGGRLLGLLAILVAVGLAVFALIGRRGTPPSSSEPSSAHMSSRTAAMASSRDLTSPETKSRDGGVCGHVFDPGGRPREKARVVLDAETGTQTDGEGRFCFTDLAPGSEHSVRASVPAEHLVTWPVTSVASTENVVLRLRRGAGLKVTVLDPHGTPVAGASVEAGVLGREHGVTGRDGTVNFDALNAGTCQLVARHERFGIITSSLLLVAGTDSAVTLSLQDSRALRCSVVGPDGSRLAGVGLQLEQNGGLRSDSALVIDTGATGEEGSISFPNVPKISVRVRVVSPLFDGPETLVTPEKTEVVITARKKEPVRGVVFEPSGHPAVGARVTARTAAGNVLDHAVTDAKGSFELGALGAARSAIVSAQHETGSIEEEVGLDTHAPLQLLLNSGEFISGTVRHVGGSPIEGARVSASPAEAAEIPTSLAHPAGRVASASSDATGHFILSGLSAGQSYLVKARSPGEPETSPLERGVVARAGDRNVELVIQQSGFVTGRIVANPPETGATIAFDEEVSSAAPDSTGRFTSPGLPAGFHGIRITGTGGSFEGTVAVRGGETTDLGSIRLTGTRSVEGVIRSEVRVELTRFSVSAYELSTGAGFNNTPPSRITAADATGSFRLDGLPDRPLMLRASDGNLVGAVQVPAGAVGSVEILVRNARRLSGVVTSSGRPPSMALVSASAGGSSPLAVVPTDSSGAFAIDGIDAPTVTLKASARAGPMTLVRQLSLSTAISADAPVQIDLGSGDSTLRVEFDAPPQGRRELLFVAIVLGRPEVSSPQQYQQLMGSGLDFETQSVVVELGGTGVFNTIPSGQHAFCFLQSAYTDQDVLWKRTQLQQGFGSTILARGCRPVSVAPSATTTIRASTLAQSN